jgi:2-dehydro-3-deoxygluconokinase
MSGRLVFFGELLIRLTAPGNELLMQSPSLTLHVGGAEANVAIGLAHLGHDCAMVSKIPSNALGRGAVAAVRGANVDCTAVTPHPGRMGLYFLAVGAGLRASEIVYDRAGSSFAASGAADYDWDALLAGARLLHLSGITPALGPRSADAALAAARAAKRRGVPISFDGNYRAMLWEAWDSDPRAILSELIGTADILFGYHRDLSLVLGREFGGGVDARQHDAARAAFERFPQLGAIASTNREIVSSDHHRVSARIDTRGDAFCAPALEITGIVDRIGTGDAFAAGVLAHLHEGLEAAATIGLALAALKHGIAGDHSTATPRDLTAFASGLADVRR